MGRIVTINLNDTPWPGSILKYNEELGKMGLGDRLIATLKDADAIQTIEIILKHTPGLTFHIQGGAETFRIEAEKR